MSIFFITGEKVHFIKRHLGIMSSFNAQEERQLAREFVLHYLKDDGVFVTRLLSLNSSDLVVTEIINQLWMRYKAAHRLYSTGQQSRSNSHQYPSNEINGIAATPSSINDHARQRPTRIPASQIALPPPLPTFVQRSKSQQLKNEPIVVDPSKSSKDTDV